MVNSVCEIKPQLTMLEEVRETEKHEMFGIIVLVVVMVSALSLPQTFAVPKGKISPQLPSRYVIRAVSNPSGGCASLGLKGYHGSIAIANGQLFIGLVNANAEGTYTVAIGHKTSSGGCDGTWKQLGSIDVNLLGDGGLTVSQKLSSNTPYILEFSDGAGTPVYATPFITM